DDVTLVQRREDGALVGEVLVDRSDADARDLGDPVGRDRVEAIALQELDSRVEHRLHGVPRPLLRGLTPGVSGARAQTSPGPDMSNSPSSSRSPIAARP